MTNASITTIAPRSASEIALPSSNIVPFQFEGAAVRVISQDGEPWFVLADVCRVLAHTNPTVAASRLDDDEKTTLNNTEGQAGRGAQSFTIINESGLYSLILTSRKPAAKRFKKWVTAEVLPTIRKTGGYNTATPLNLEDPHQLRQVLLGYTERLIDAERRLEAAKPKEQFFDRFANAEGVYGLQNAARALGQQPNKFIDSLKRKYLFYQGGDLVPYQQYVRSGLFTVKCSQVQKPNGDDKAVFRTYMTPKGLQYFGRKLAASDPVPLGI